MYISFILQGTNKKMSCFCLQCWWYWGPAECWPCGWVIGGTWAHWDTSARSVWFRLVPGQQAVPLHRLCGRCQLCSHWDHKERHQVREPTNIIITWLKSDFVKFTDNILIRWWDNQVTNLDITSNVYFLPAWSGTGEGSYQRGAGRPIKERSGIVSSDTESSHQ